MSPNQPVAWKADIDSEPESIEDDKTSFQQRDPRYLDRNLFDPVWVPSDENLSGDFPEELHQLVGLGETVQRYPAHAYTSYRACEKLAASLQGIVHIN